MRLKYGGMGEWIDGVSNLEKPNGNGEVERLSKEFSRYSISTK